MSIIFINYYLHNNQKNAKNKLYILKKTLLSLSFNNGFDLQMLILNYFLARQGIIITE